MKINRYTYEIPVTRFSVNIPDTIPREKIDRIALRALYKQEVIGLEDIDCIAISSYEVDDDDY